MAQATTTRKAGHANKVSDENDPITVSTAVIENASLKKHLLGPSMGKSGQDGVDQAKVAEVIFEASKGSKYFKNESRKDEDLTRRIDRILRKKAELEKLDLSKEFRQADELIASLELDRDLSQTVIHVDCDAFYASVEELDHPEYKTVPMAVGKGVLTTCNYEARKFGCRSGMAGHIAMKLCPQLVCVPLNFEKYTAKAKEVREVLVRYDERFEAASVDEAYLNITKYIQKHNLTPDEAVENIRNEVHAHAKITISAGIAPNARIAKIASNKNKPNGQFRIEGDRTTVMSFMRNLPVRKVNGVGRVFERELEAVGIKTCGDIYPLRGLLSRLFGQKAYEFLISVHLGLGRTEIRPAGEYIRKSIGTESTFRDLEGTPALREKLRATAESLEEDMVRTQLAGRTLALKIKMHSYEEAIRQKPLPRPMWKAQDLYDFALPLLSKLEMEYKPMKLRLMGLRLTSLTSQKKDSGGAVDFFKPQLQLKKRKSMDEPVAEQWESWPEDEWEKYNNDGYQQPVDTPTEDELLYFDGLKSDDLLDVEEGGSGGHNTPTTTRREDTEEEVFWPCPICGLPQPAEDRAFNDHVDFCLSKSTIREAVKETEEKPTTPPLRPETSTTPENATINAIFREYKKSGSSRNPVPSNRGRPRGKRRKL